MREGANPEQANTAPAAEPSITTKPAVGLHRAQKLDKYLYATEHANIAFLNAHPQ